MQTRKTERQMTGGDKRRRKERENNESEGVMREEGDLR